MALRTSLFTLLFIASAALSACRRPEAEQVRGGPAAPSLSMEAEASAAAEVTASSGAVRINLRAHQTTIIKGGSLWLQIAIVNVSSGPLMVRDNDYLSLMGLVGQELGVSLRLQDETGRDATARLDSLYEGHVPLGCMRPEDKKRWEDSIRGKTNTSGNSDLGVVWLKPGESALSASFGYQSGSDRYCARKAPPKNIFPFAEFAQVRSLGPGRYKIFLSYDMSPKPGSKSYPGDVTFKLPPLSFEVRP